jgi:hypothetical protein
MTETRGRKKGYSPYYTHITYEELADWVGRKTKVPVSKRWLESIMGEEFIGGDEIPLDKPTDKEYDENPQPKIEYTLTQL